MRLLPAPSPEHHSAAVGSVPCADSRARSYTLAGWDMAAVSELACGLGGVSKGEEPYLKGSGFAGKADATVAGSVCRYLGNCADKCVC